MHYRQLRGCAPACLTADVRQKMSATSSSPKVWPLPVAVIAALASLTSTFYFYAERHRLHQEGSPLPAVVGIVAFTLSMALLTLAMIAKERRSVARIVGIVALEVAAFIYAFMFLLLNVYGS